MHFFSRTKKRSSAPLCPCERGFTLTELLVVVAIIGILAAMGLVQYSVFRTRAFDAAARSDLFALVDSEEAFFVGAESYQNCANAGCNHPALPGFSGSANTTSVCAALLGGSEYRCATRHLSGTKTFYYDSFAGSFWSVP